MGSKSKKISEEIRTLLLNALERKGWYFFENPNLSKCWEELDCTNTHCPSYKSSNLRCWQISGTYCEGEPQGMLAKKIGDCHKCKVYKKAVDGDVILQIGEDFNNLMFQLKTKEDELRLTIQDSEEKNRELEELNKKIQGLLKKLDNKNLQLKELSIKDGLTDLYNYRFFSKSLQDQYHLAERYNFPLSFIMIDIDYFKAINDTYGHQFGDEILKQLAGILTDNVRDTDKLVRYGGEEFAILLPHTDIEDAYIKAERLRELISNYNFKIQGEKLGITISSGVAAYPANKGIHRAERLVNYADKALYQAKEQGRNMTVLFTDTKSLEESGKKIVRDEELMERRQYPRIQTLIRIKGEMNKRETSLSNAFDISCSGLSLVSREPIDKNKILKLRLFLPGIGENENKVTEVNTEGVVVWCKGIDDSLYKKAGSKQKPRKYLIGIRFTDISRKDSIYLQKYFFSIFEIEKKCLR
jgi:diguanylate cyclase (GGDEF)-like protein